MSSKGEVKPELYEQLAQLAKEKGAQPIIEKTQQEYVCMLCKYIVSCCDNHKYHLVMRNIGLVYHVWPECTNTVDSIRIRVMGIHEYSTEVLCMQQTWSVKELSTAYAAHETIRVAVTTLLERMADELEQRCKAAEQRLGSTQLR